MAGFFGYQKKDKFELSMQIGGLVLFPAVGAARRDAIVAATGTSCRHQILDATGREAQHPLQILNARLLSRDSVLCS